MLDGHKFSENSECLGNSESWSFIALNGGKVRQAFTTTKYSIPASNKGDIVTCEIDFKNESIRYYVNGKDQGIAFTDFKANAGARAAASLVGNGTSISFYNEPNLIEANNNQIEKHASFDRTVTFL